MVMKFVQRVPGANSIASEFSRDWFSRIGPVITCALFLCSFSPLSVSAQGFAPLGKCDELAAHPNDPFRFAAGQADATVDAELAIKSCKSAVEKNPAVGRLRFQLGRSLFLSGKSKEAREHLERAIDLKYVQAGAYLAAIYEASPDSSLNAKTIALRASAKSIGLTEKISVNLQAKHSPILESPNLEIEHKDNIKPLALGFSKKAKRVPDISREAQARAEYFQSPEKVKFKPVQFNPEGFQQGQVLKNLFEGNFDEVSRNDIPLLHYFKFFNETMSAKGIGTSSTACLKLYQVGLEGAMAGAALDAAGLGGSYEETSRQGWRLLGNMLQGVHKRGLRTFTDGAARKQEMINSGPQDAILLSRQYGCDHAAVKAIYENMGRFLRKRSPQLLPGVIKQQEQRKFRLNAEESCNRSYDGSQFCSCAVGLLKNQQLNNAAWKLLSSDFNSIVKITPAIPSYRTSLASCH